MSDLDSIRNSCDVLYLYLLYLFVFVYSYFCESGGSHLCLFFVFSYFHTSVKVEVLPTSFFVFLFK